MTTILAGHVQLQDQADQAREELLRAGFKGEQISTFFVNQPGQHDTTGGNVVAEESTGTDEVPEGAGEGMVVGAAIGAAGGVIAGPVGPALGALVGAHIGSLFSFSKMKEAGEKDEDGGNVVAPRLSGMLVAVAVPASTDEPRAIEVFKRLGVHHLERAEGTISNGDWSDFNPLSVPVLLDPPPQAPVQQ
jgi:hypothetical protein